VVSPKPAMSVPTENRHGGAQRAILLELRLDDASCSYSLSACGSWAQPILTRDRRQQINQKLPRRQHGDGQMMKPGINQTLKCEPLVKVAEQLRKTIKVIEEALGVTHQTANVVEMKPAKRRVRA
jgi:hypothetical protein